MSNSQDRYLPMFSSEAMREIESDVVDQFDKGLVKTGVCIVNNASSTGKYFTVGLHLLGMEEFIFEGSEEVMSKVSSVIDLALEQDLLPSEVTDAIEDLGLNWFEVESEEFLYGVGLYYRFWLESKNLETPRFLEVYQHDTEK